MKKDVPFKVIDGTPAPDTPKEQRLKRMRASAAKTPELIHCKRCTSIAVIEVKIGMRYKNGKAIGGQKQTVCASCLARGEYVVLTI